MRIAHRLHSCISIYIEAVYTSSVMSERMVGGAPANEVLPHWIHGAVLVMEPRKQNLDVNEPRTSIMVNIEVTDVSKTKPRCFDVFLKKI